MTDALTIQEPPDPMRIIQTDIGAVIPINDIVDYIGYSRSAVNKKMKEYEGKMTPCKTFIPLETSGGIQRFVALNRTGVDYLFLLIHPSKTRMTNDQLLEFRKHILDKMDGERKEITQVPENTLDLELDIAKHLSEKTGGDLAAFQAIALKRHGLDDYIPALKQTIYQHGEMGWYSVTQLVARCNDPLLNPERLNHYLSNNPRDPERRPYQYRDGNHLWRLTPLGAEHGREYVFTAPSGHSEPRIAWRISILEAAGLVRHPEQTALPGARV